MIILGLGSNLGNRQANLDKAIEAISANLLDDLKFSKIYKTAPMLPPDPEQGWKSKQFLNMAIGGKLKHKFEPEEFLHKIKAIETKIGRTLSGRWAPRIIDIDILAWDNLIYSSTTLTIPHIGLLERDFTLKPVTDIAPNWVHPLTGKTICSYLE